MQLHPILERVVNEAVKRDASDFFLAPGEPPVLRLKQELVRLEEDPLTPETVAEIARTVVGDQEVHRVGEITQPYALPGVFNGSVSVARSLGHYTIAGRVLPTRVLSVDDVRLPEAIREAALASHGLLISAGLAGSGKTTAVYAMLDHINARRACHICTVEGPACIPIPPKKALIQQRLIGLDVPDCLSGIRAALRQDLDVLYTEVSTAEELQACLAAADTNHFVVLQVHADSPHDALDRLVNLIPEELRDQTRQYLARLLRGVVAMRLAPAVGGGRLAVYGVLIPDDAMRAAIAAGRSVYDRADPLPPGCQSMAEHADRLRREGAIE